MSTKTLLKEAKPVNVREAQATLSKLISSKAPSLVMSHGKPVSFLIPYDEMLELLDLIEELKDKRLLEQIAEARKAYAKGEEVPVEKLFRKINAV